MDYDLERLRDQYGFGKPLTVNGVTIRFLTYMEYLEYIQELTLISMNSLHIYYHYKKAIEDDDVETLTQLEELKNAPLYDIVVQSEMFLQAYVKIFRKVFDDRESILEEIFSSEKNFMSCRALIMDMNMISEDEVAEDKKVQEFIEKSRRVRQRSVEKQTVYDILSSIVVGTGYSYESLADMTVFQIYLTYYRIGAMKTYDTMTLFATVSSDVKIDAWNKSIDLFEKQTAGIKASEFNKTFGGLFK